MCGVRAAGLFGNSVRYKAISLVVPKNGATGRGIDVDRISRFRQNCGKVFKYASARFPSGLSYLAGAGGLFLSPMECCTDAIACRCSPFGTLTRNFKMALSSVGVLCLFLRITYNIGCAGYVRSVAFRGAASGGGAEKPTPIIGFVGNAAAGPCPARKKGFSAVALAKGGFAASNELFLSGTSTKNRMFEGLGSGSVVS